MGTSPKVSVWVPGFGCPDSRHFKQRRSLSGTSQNRATRTTGTRQQWTRWNSWQRNYTALQPHEKEVVEVLEEQATRRDKSLNSPRVKRGKNTRDKSLRRWARTKKTSPMVSSPHGYFSMGPTKSGSTKGQGSETRNGYLLQRISKRIMREKSRVDEKTFALTAHVKEAHRQIPIATVRLETSSAVKFAPGARCT